MRLAAAGRPVCLTVTELSGIVVARSAFENSLRYRSAGHDRTPPVAHRSHPMTFLP
jgi:hypothetical protein